MQKPSLQIEPFLNVQLTGAGKCFLTMCTSITSLQYDLFHEPSWIEISEGLYTMLKWIKIGEGFCTIFKWIRLLKSVTSFMSVMTTEVTEGFSKMFTCSRLFPYVNLFMNVQVIGAGKHFFTLLKWIWIPFNVNTFHESYKNWNWYRLFQNASMKKISLQYDSFHVS